MVVVVVGSVMYKNMLIYSVRSASPTPPRPSCTTCLIAFLYNMYFCCMFGDCTTNSLINLNLRWKLLLLLFSPSPPAADKTPTWLVSYFSSPEILRIILCVTWLTENNHDSYSSSVHSYATKSSSEPLTLVSTSFTLRSTIAAPPSIALSHSQSQQERVLRLWQPVQRLIAFCVAPMEVHHFPDIVLPVPHSRLLRLTSVSTIIPGRGGWEEHRQTDSSISNAPYSRHSLSSHSPINILDD